jgi:hypothetical protein
VYVNLLTITGSAISVCLPFAWTELTQVLCYPLFHRTTVVGEGLLYYPRWWLLLYRVCITDTVWPVVLHRCHIKQSNTMNVTNQQICVYVNLWVAYKPMTLLVAPCGRGVSDGRVLSSSPNLLPPPLRRSSRESGKAWTVLRQRPLLYPPDRGLRGVGRSG